MWKSAFTNTTHLLIPCQNSKWQKGKAPKVIRTLNLRWDKEAFFIWGPPLFSSSSTCFQKKPHRHECSNGIWPSGRPRMQNQAHLSTVSSISSAFMLYLYLKPDKLDAIISLRLIGKQKKKKEKKNVQWIRQYKHAKSRTGIITQALSPPSLSTEEAINWHKGKRKFQIKQVRLMLLSQQRISYFRKPRSY